MSVVSREINYAQPSVAHSVYQWNRITPISIPATNSTSGGEIADYIISPGAYNLSKFIYSYQTSNAASGNGQNNFNHIGGCNVYSVSLQTRSGLQLVLVNDADIYSRVAGTRQPLVDMMSSDIPLSTCTAVGNLTGNVPAANTVINAAAAFSDSVAGAAAKPYVSRRLILAGGANAVQFLQYAQKMGDLLPDTLFGIDKTLFFPEEMVLRFTFGPSTNYNFNANTGSLTAGAAAGNALTLSNMYLYMATEKNLEIVNDLQHAIKSATGFQLKIPFVFENIQSFGAVSAQNSTFRIGPGYGRKIKKIYTAPWAATRTLSNVYNFNNAQHVTSWTSTINSQQLESFADSPSLNWLVNSQRLKDTVLQNQTDYNTTFVIEKSFSNSPDAAESFRGEYVSDGLTLEPSSDLIYGIQCTTDGTAMTWYQFSVLEKLLKIDSQNGIQLLV